MPKSSNTAIDPGTAAALSIVVLRGQRVILDSRLATLYGVPTRRLNEQIKRNRTRFPGDFMFRLSAAEAAALNRSQIATGSQKHRSSKYRPYAFTEHGSMMAATVLNSREAIEMSLFVVRAFVRLRQLLATNTELRQILADVEARLESKLLSHEKAIGEILAVLRNLMSAPSGKTRGIGFTADV